MTTPFKERTHQIRNSGEISCQLSDCGSFSGHSRLIKKMANEDTIPTGRISALLYEEWPGAYQAHVIQIRNGSKLSHRIAMKDEA